MLKTYKALNKSLQYLVMVQYHLLYLGMVQNLQKKTSCYRINMLIIFPLFRIKQHISCCWYFLFVVSHNKYVDNISSLKREWLITACSDKQWYYSPESTKLQPCLLSLQARPTIYQINHIYKCFNTSHSNSVVTWLP